MNLSKLGSSEGCKELDMISDCHVQSLHGQQLNKVINSTEDTGGGV